MQLGVSHQRDILVIALNILMVSQLQRMVLQRVLSMSEAVIVRQRSLHNRYYLQWLRRI